MPEASSTPPGTLGSKILRRGRRTVLGMDPQKLIKNFFGANSSIAIIVLVLIMVFLLREGAGFLSTYHHELETYRKAGLEFCDIADTPLKQQQTMASSLRRALSIEMEPLVKTARERRDAAFLFKRAHDEKNSEGTATFDASPLFSPEEKNQLKAELAALTPESTDLPATLQKLAAEFAAKDREAKTKFKTIIEAEETFEEAAEPVAEILDELKTHATETKEAANEFHTLEAGRQQLLAAAASASGSEKADLLKEAELSKVEEPKYAERVETLLEKREDLVKALGDYVTAVEEAAKSLQSSSTHPEAAQLIASVEKAIPTHLADIQKASKDLTAWKWDEPVSFFRAVGSFAFGTGWITNSSWQDFYGVVPLLTGSLLISFVALFIATPISVTAAIYTNQFASEREKELIKPVIEFIQAIPSVVLGFIGIAVVGDLIKGFSQWEFLSWIPGFPIQERLNIFNAGFLLAFMAVPTMFSLSEDALNNVPRAYSEASDALGATKLQTVFRVIVPAAISGILSAILLGLGRVIGETMVVLLVAGNRIAIPDFSDGLGAIFQPAHTLTGIIAQELGEVSRGSSHWQALFMVGILLFVISLSVNWCARTIAKRFEHPKA